MISMCKETYETIFLPSLTGICILIGFVVGVLLCWWREWFMKRED